MKLEQHARQAEFESRATRDGVEMLSRTCPIASVIAVALAFGEELTARELLGGAIILLGLWIVVRVEPAPALSAAAEH